jgi:hypothetical protein
MYINVFMSDDAPAFYNACAWSSITTEVPNQLIGMWIVIGPTIFKLFFEKIKIKVGVIS